MMVSPLIDEDMMVQFLKLTEEDTPTIDRLRTGASMLLLDAFDRKITRNQFLAALGAAVTLIDAVGKHDMMTSVKSFFEEKNGVSLADIEVALHSTRQAMDTGCSQCTKMANLLQQCPLSEDKVH